MSSEPEAAVDPDLRLLVLVNDGDTRAQRLLVSRLAPRVQRICRAIVRHPADAEDAAQMSLLEILRAAPSFAGASRLEAWADRIAARTATRHVVRERRRAAIVPPIPESSHDPDLAEGLARPLSAYLDELPAPQRQVLVLRHALGYSNAEIAELTEVPPGTVKDRLVRARKHVRKLIAREQAIGRRRGAQR